MKRPKLVCFTYAGKLSLSTIKRYDKQTISNNEISCPFVVKEYKRHMDAVDLLGAFVTKHNIIIKKAKITTCDSSTILYDTM